jgi:hypothetical protein
MPDSKERVRGGQAPMLRIGDRFNPYKCFPGSFVPEPICRYRGLSPGAKLTYGRLCRYAGEDGAAFPGIAALAEATGLGETQSRGYIKELERERFVEVDREHRHYRKDGSGGSNRYVFLWHEAFLGESGALRKAPPPLRKTEGVPPRKTEPLTPPGKPKPKRVRVFKRVKERESVNI